MLWSPISSWERYFNLITNFRIKTHPVTNLLEFGGPFEIPNYFLLSVCGCSHGVRPFILCDSLHLTKKDAGGQFNLPFVQSM